MLVNKKENKTIRNKETTTIVIIIKVKEVYFKCEECFKQ